MVTVLFMKFQDILVLIATVRELINSSHSETPNGSLFCFDTIKVYRQRFL